MKQRLFTNDVEVYRKECNCCTYINDRTLDFIEFSEPMIRFYTRVVICKIVL